MQRRTYLAISVGTVGSLAGCSGILGGSDGGDGDGGDTGDGDTDEGDSSGDGDPVAPDEVSRAFVEAIVDGDVEGANDLIHSESPFGEVGQSTVESFQSRDASVDEVTVESRNDSTARVDVVLEARTEDGDRGTVTFPIELRKRDGEWLVYEDLSATGPPPRPPQVRWESSVRTDADGSVTAVVFNHHGGDTVQSGTLSVQADGSAATVPEGTDVTTSWELVVSTDGSGNSVPASTEVELVWSDPDRGDTQVIASHTLESATAGSLSDTVTLET